MRLKPRAAGKGGTRRIDSGQRGDCGVGFGLALGGGVGAHRLAVRVDELMVRHAQEVQQHLPEARHVAADHLGRFRVEIGVQLQTLGGTVPTLDPAMQTLNNALGDPAGALAAAGSANVVVGQVLSASDFAPTVVTPAAAPEPAGSLPRTGTEEGTFAGAAIVLAILGLAVRRWSRRSTSA